MCSFIAYNSETEFETVFRGFIFLRYLFITPIAPNTNARKNKCFTVCFVSFRCVTVAYVAFLVFFFDAAWFLIFFFSFFFVIYIFIKSSNQIVPFYA